MGLSTLPFLSIIVQYIDSITGFSSGNGYHANHMDYIFESPLVYMGVVFCINIVCKSEVEGYTHENCNH